MLVGRDGLIESSHQAAIYPCGAPAASKLGCKPRLSNRDGSQPLQPTKTKKPPQGRFLNFGGP